MLFVFNGPHQASFWMKKHVVGFPALTSTQDGVILEEQDMKPKDENPNHRRFPRAFSMCWKRSKSWFEAPQTSKKWATQIRTERGTLAETFFRQR